MITRHYAATMYNRTNIKAHDLAVGGGTIERGLVNPVFPTAQTFGDQIEKKFSPYYGPQGTFNGWLPSRSLFAVCFGIMDMIIPFHESERPPVDKLVKAYEAELVKVCYVPQI